MHHLRSDVRNAGAAIGPEANKGIGFPRLYDLLVLMLTRGRDRAYREALLDLAGLAPGFQLLDVGCGTGTQAIAAWRRVQPGGSVVGVDVSEKMLAVARRKAGRAGLDIAFHHADAAVLRSRMDASMPSLSPRCCTWCRKQDAAFAFARLHAFCRLADGCC
ncbi:hypothetical protein AU467_01660 [Mesorhizobium loti]|uniref:Methyltransferase domain-containing protein n=1 Tax=Rhizobium loti TaxID=381 RepID=A0A101KXV2_RHILI|nr:hypothetical protein AU467_01660 [Mesorhizobium loti]